MSIIYSFDGTVEFNSVLLDLFTSGSQVLKTGTTIADLICSSLKVLFCCFIYYDVQLLGTYTCTQYIFMVLCLLRVLTLLLMCHGSFPCSKACSI